MAASYSRLTSPNIVAKLEGSDPKLKSEYVAVSAHLDHLGVGAPINGDRIYNGAMDDASGVATVLDIAHRLKTRPCAAPLCSVPAVHGRRKRPAGLELFCQPSHGAEGQASSRT